MALALVSRRDRPDSDRMATHTQPNTQPNTQPADAWRDVWTDPDTARINARLAEVRHTEDDMAEYYRRARNAV